MDMWTAINEYVASCGGDTSAKSLSDRRMNAVVAVERAMIARQARDMAHLEAGVRGQEGCYPDWVYESREAIRHRDQNVPWLDDLLAALEWQGGTIHDALNCVRRLIEANKMR